MVQRTMPIAGNSVEIPNLARDDSDSQPVISSNARNPASYAEKLMTLFQSSLTAKAFPRYSSIDLEERRLAATDQTLHLATRSGWYRFELRDGTWTETEKALTFFSVSCLQVDPANSRRVIAGTENFGLFSSDDRGDTWQRPEPNVPQLSTWSMLALPGKLLVGTRPAALFSSDATGSWNEFADVRRGAMGGTFPPNPESAPRTRFLCADPRSANRLYAAIEVGGMLLSDDGGAHWSTANQGLADLDVHQVQSSAKHAGVVIAACGEASFRSEDRGAHWQEVTPAGHRTYGTAVTEANSGTLYLGIADGRPRTWIRPARADAAVFASSDGGKHWDIAASGLRGAVIDLIPGFDGQGALIATSEGEVMSVDASGCRTIISGLPALNAMVAVG